MRRREVVEFGQRVLNLRELWKNYGIRVRPGLAYSWQGWGWVLSQLGSDSGVLIDSETWALLERRLRQNADRRPPNRMNTAYVGGWGSPLIAAKLSVHDRSWKPFVRDRIRSLRALPLPIPADLFSGTAGLLSALWQIEKYAPGSVPKVYRRAVRNQFIGQLTQVLSSPSEGRHLGLAHGAAGLLVGLELSHRFVPDHRTATLRRQLLETIAGDGKGAWKFVTGQTSRTPFQSWCSGTPGITRGLLHAHALSGDRTYVPVLARAERAMDTGMNEEWMPTDGLCCGRLGVTETLLDLALATGKTKYRRRAQKLFDAVDPTFQRDTPPAEAYFDRPSLFKGMLGWIYVGLRLTESPEAIRLPPTSLDLN